MNMKKKEYTKPSIKLVEWEFSEAMCSSVVYRNSFNSCFTVEKENAVNAVENRADITGDWNWVGSTPSRSGSR